MASESDGLQLCGFCGKSIDGLDEYIIATCSKCGADTYHFECSVSALQKLRLDNSASSKRAKDKSKTYPHEVMCHYKLACIRRGKEACSGMVINAELLKPHKHVGPAAPRAPRQSSAARKVAAELARQQASQAAADKAAREARTQTQATKATNATFGDAGEGRGGRSLRAGHARRTGSMLSFPPGARPKHLQMCRNMEEDGDCRIYRCPYCHSEEELKQREQEWQAAQEAKRRAERQRQLEAAKAEAARRTEEERFDAAAREAEAREEDFLCMSDASLSLLKEFKRSRCHAVLLELGFDEGTALAAAAATGCDADRAVALLMDGGLARGSRPVLVTQEAQELLAFGGSLGLDREEVELAILLAQGDPQAAKEELQSRRFGQAAVEEARCLSKADGVSLSQRSDAGGGTSYAGSSVGPESAVAEEAAWASAASALAAGMPSPCALSPAPAEQAGPPAAEEPAWEDAGWSFDDAPGSSAAAFPTSVSAQADYSLHAASHAPADSWSAPGSEHSSASVALAQMASPVAAFRGPDGDVSWGEGFAAGMTAATAQMGVPELPTGITSRPSVPALPSATGWSPKPTHAPVEHAPAHIPLAASAATQPAPALPTGLWENPKKGVVEGGDEGHLNSLLAMLGVQG